MVAALSGVYPILATPFRADGSVDERDLARLIDFIVAAGADGLVFPGVASEFETLAPDERAHLVAIVARCVAGRVPFVVGASAADGPAAAMHAAHAKIGRRGCRDGRCARFDAGRQGGHRRLLLANRRGGIARHPAECTPAGGVRSLAGRRRRNSSVPLGGIRYVKEETLPCGQRITRLLAARVPSIGGRVRRRRRSLYHRRARTRRVWHDARVRVDGPARAPVRTASGRRPRRRALAVQPHAAAAQFPGGVPDGDDQGSAAAPRHHLRHARARRRSALRCGRSR